MLLLFFSCIYYTTILDKNKGKNIIYIEKYKGEFGIHRYPGCLMYRDSTVGIHLLGSAPDGKTIKYH